jgi:hypothetical protein
MSKPSIDVPALVPMTFKLNGLPFHSLIAIAVIMRILLRVIRRREVAKDSKRERVYFMVLPRQENKFAPRSSVLWTLKFPANTDSN